MGTNNMTVFERRMEILIMLIRYKKIKVPIVAEMLSVSKNTVYRDISFLSRYTPIYTKNGKYGGVFIFEDFSCNVLLYLTENEIKLLERLIDISSDEDKRMLKNIINKYSMPKKII